MAPEIIFDGENADGNGIGTVKVCCMHDPYDLRCPVCGHSVFSHADDDSCYVCETCGVAITLFPDPAGCRVLVEVQGA